MSQKSKKEKKPSDFQQTEDLLEEEILPLKSKLAFGGTTISSAILSGIVFGPITFFYNVKLGLSAELCSLAWVIFIIWNTLNDPLFGFIEDSTKSEKYGRRVPYLRFGAPFYGFLFILCWYPVVNPSNDIALFVNLILVLFLFDTFFTIIGLITYSLPAEMAISSKTRSNLMIFGAIFNGLGILLSFVIPLLLLTGDQSPHLNPLFRPTMVILGITCGLIIFISSYFIKENKYTIMEESMDFLKGLKETFKNKSFLIFEVSNFSFVLARTILTTSVFYYIDYVLKLGGITSIIPIILFFSMVFAFIPVYNKMVKRIGLLKAYIIALTSTGFSFILFFFIGWNFSSAIIGMILLGISFSGYFLMGQMVMAEVIDYDEVRTGKRRETTYSGANALLTKPAVSLAASLFLTIISAFGFNSEISTQTESAQFGIMLGFTIIPAVFILISAIAMNFFPLKGEKWQKEKEKLAKIHKRKEREYLKQLKEKVELSY
ncbi:MAG: MFS transporter [Promethearchaeia archaeon]